MSFDADLARVSGNGADGCQAYVALFHQSGFERDDRDRAFINRHRSAIFQCIKKRGASGSVKTVLEPARFKTLFAQHLGGLGHCG